MSRVNALRFALVPWSTCMAIEKSSAVGFGLQSWSSFEKSRGRSFSKSKVNVPLMVVPTAQTCSGFLGRAFAQFAKVLVRAAGVRARSAIVVMTSDGLRGSSASSQGRQNLHTSGLPKRRSGKVITISLPRAAGADFFRCRA